MRSLAAAAMPLLSAVVWVAALIVDPGPLAPGSLILVGVGLLSTATVGVVGLLLVGGRWAHRTSIAAVAGTLAIAVIRDVDALWLAGVAASVVAAVILFAPTTTQRVRKLPPATGPPWRSVLLPLALLGVPFLLGLAARDEVGWPTMVVGLTAPLTAVWYARVFPGGLVVLRLLWPLMAITLAPMQGLPVGIVSATLGGVAAGLAWHPTVKVAFHPPRHVGTAYAIPPELAPPDVLDTASLDERGRRK